MEVNRLNPTKSIRIEGISHFAFVNGWLLRSWGGVDVSQAVCRKRASAPVAQPPLLAPTVPRVDRDLSAAATGIRARRHGAARGEQPPECTSLKQTGLAYGCGDPCLSRGAGRVSVCAGAVRRLPVTSVGTGSLQVRALRFVEKAVLRKRKEPHCWGSEGAMGFEEDFV